MNAATTSFVEYLSLKYLTMMHIEHECSHHVTVSAVWAKHAEQRNTQDCASSVSALTGCLASLNTNHRSNQLNKRPGPHLLASTWAHSLLLVGCQRSQVHVATLPLTAAAASINLLDGAAS
jgi:hypothetical protein